MAEGSKAVEAVFGVSKGCGGGDGKCGVPPGGRSGIYGSVLFTQKGAIPTVTLFGPSVQERFLSDQDYYSIVLSNAHERESTLPVLKFPKSNQTAPNRSV